MVTKYKCPNGVRILTEKLPYVRSVAMGIWVNVGSGNERPEENGLTHFIEHMLFKGTHSRTAKEIAESFDRIGGQLNAFTSKENTCYYAITLDHHAEEAITLLTDMFFHSTFAEDDIEKERQVIFEEMSMVEDTPDDDVDERLWSAMYPHHPMGAPILGTEETLETFTKDKIETYMYEHYTPDQVVVSVAGNITDRLIHKIIELFDQFNNTNHHSKIIQTIPKFLPGQTTKESNTEQAHLAIGYEGLTIKNPDLMSLLVVNNILGDTTSSRLFQQVREEQALAYSIFSYYTAYEHAGAFMIYGGTSPEKLTMLEETILQITEQMVNDGVSSIEIQYAKEQLESNLLLGLETSNDFMNHNAKNELLYGRERTVEQTLQELHAVDEESVNRVIQMLLTKPYAKSVIQPAKGGVESR
ncbi:M16 family metallopeptidase [Rummeliibacillus suwonensis]|uniref:M16 family metallopeptidase n=1 Tax=Rummeliibacillus suwonensis TaxID=1306154 RepID=UPI001AAF7A2C|nr:pitrilysin family protein [Rummeliibacillus suwonensis]MBO2534623.1 insulinase family protein [Rummeliibacillus suwonensis]